MDIAWFGDVENWWKLVEIVGTKNWWKYGGNLGCKTRGYYLGLWRRKVVEKYPIPTLAPHIWPSPLLAMLFNLGNLFVCFKCMCVYLLRKLSVSLSISLFGGGGGNWQDKLATRVRTMYA